MAIHQEPNAFRPPIEVQAQRASKPRASCADRSVRPSHLWCHGTNWAWVRGLHLGVEGLVGPPGLLDIGSAPGAGPQASRVRSPARSPLPPRWVVAPGPPSPAVRRAPSRQGWSRDPALDRVCAAPDRVHDRWSCGRDSVPSRAVPGSTPGAEPGAPRSPCAELVAAGADAAVPDEPDRRWVDDWLHRSHVAYWETQAER